MSEQFSGRVTIVDAQGREVFRFDSQFSVLDIGAAGNGGDLRIANETGITVLRFDAKAAVLDIGPSGGGQGPEGDLRVFGPDGQVKIHLDGNTGDIKLVGADCAEQFDADETQTIEPGSVMTIGDGGRLRLCMEPYDRRVAGVVSGAAGLHPGIVMDSRQGQQRRTPLALTGKVYCRVDASYGPIDVGDLLTTSSTAGHAMKVVNPARAWGATLGKALQPLRTGTGLVPILVGLQ